MTRTLYPTLTLLAVALSGMAPPTLTAQKKRYEVVPLGETGTIKGVVRYVGTPPAPKKIDVGTAEQPCHQRPIFSERLAVSDGGLVKGAVVYIKGIQQGKAFPKTDEAIKLRQRGCNFSPHVLTVPVGQELIITNEDGILHNVHVKARRNRPGNYTMAGSVKEMRLKFRRPEKVYVGCDVHTWMMAWVVATEHPYYAVTGDDGTFVLTDVPPGRHKLVLWHETRKKGRTLEVEVLPGKETTVEFILNAKKRRSR